MRSATAMLSIQRADRRVVIIRGHNNRIKRQETVGVLAENVRVVDGNERTSWKDLNGLDLPV